MPNGWDWVEGASSPALETEADLVTVHYDERVIVSRASLDAAGSVGRQAVNDLVKRKVQATVGANVEVTIEWLAYRYEVDEDENYTVVEWEARAVGEAVVAREQIIPSVANLRTVLSEAQVTDHWFEAPNLYGHLPVWMAPRQART